MLRAEHDRMHLADKLVFLLSDPMSDSMSDLRPLNTARLIARLACRPRRALRRTIVDAGSGEAVCRRTGLLAAALGRRRSAIRRTRPAGQFMVDRRRQPGVPACCSIRRRSAVRDSLPRLALAVGAIVDAVALTGRSLCRAALVTTSTSVKESSPGVLVEVLPDGRHIVGIGLNSNNSAVDAPPELRRQVATSLRILPAARTILPSC